MTDWNLDLEPEPKEEESPQENPPRRYEIIDAETGEKVQGTSFLLTPTGEEMHLLSDEGHWVGPLKLGIYYSGNPLDGPGPGGPRQADIIKSMALYYIIDVSLEKLARGFPLSSPSANAGNLRYVARGALQLAEELDREEGQRTVEARAQQIVEAFKANPYWIVTRTGATVTFTEKEK